MSTHTTYSLRVENNHGHLFLMAADDSYQGGASLCRISEQFVGLTQYDSLTELAEHWRFLKEAHANVIKLDTVKVVQRQVIETVITL